MKSKLALRIAALLVLVHLVGHMVGHITWDQPTDPKMQEVVTVMKGYKAEFMGATKSMGDYYHGYSLLMVCVYAMSVWILWVVSGFITEHRAPATKVLYPFSLTYLAFGVIEFLFFFPFAASMSFLAGILSLAAITYLKK